MKLIDWAAKGFPTPQFNRDYEDGLLIGFTGAVFAGIFVIGCMFTATISPLLWIAGGMALAVMFAYVVLEYVL